MGDSSPPSSSTRQSRSRREFQRVYKACESCRRKKSRCILDSGSPTGHPCARCRRELRECVFSEDRSTQRKPAAAQQKGNSISRKDNIHVAVSPRCVDDDANQSRRRTVVDLSSANVLAPTMTASPGPNDSGALPSPGSTFRQPSRAADSGFGNSPNTSTGRLADAVMRTVVSSENDALNLLFKAAEQSHDENNANSVPQHEQGACLHDYTTPSSRVADLRDLSLPGTDVVWVWGAFRFTKMGWLTAQEAVTYMDLFFANLAPLTPVIDQYYASHENHFSLITQEPLLCCTILLISSRYHVLPGAGSTFRAILLHQRLWEHCQHLVSRITFGQEKKSKAKTRTVGSILALLLLTEWHPWAIHFPPAADGWDSDLLLSMSDHRDQPGSNTADDIDTHARWLGDVARPAKMSDRMSWMLIGCAMSLAHELGVCDPATDVDSTRGNNRHTFGAFEPRRIGKLLYIFAEQLSWRLGCASMVSTSLSQSASETIPAPRDASILDSLVLNAWIELTTLTRAISDALFPSTAVTRQLLLSGRHVNIIKHFQQQLVRWRVAHLDSHGMNEIFQETLTIEYQYLRIFMNSLGMQAVCDRVSGDVTWDHSAAQLHTSITPTDYEFIRVVIDGTCEILESVCRLADAGRLRYSTIRVIMRVIAASIFLLKALSLGAWTAQLERSLSILERSIEALRSSALDDMHLASRYAALLDLHVARFRDSFVASTVPQGLPPAELDIGLRDADATGVLENIGHDSFQLSDDWLSMPFDISMAPFGVTGDTEELLGLDHGNWNFLWNLPLV